MVNPNKRMCLTRGSKQQRPGYQTDVHPTELSGAVLRKMYVEQLQYSRTLLIHVGFVTEGNSLPTAPIVTTATPPVSGLMRQSNSSSPCPNEGTIPYVEAVDGTLEALAEGAPELTTVPDTERSGDDLWPFPFPKDPSDSWSENGGY